MEYIIIDEIGIPIARFKVEHDRDICLDFLSESYDDAEFKAMNGDTILKKHENKMVKD